MTLDVLSEVRFVRHATSPADRANVYAQVRRGQLVGVTTGAFLSRSTWDSLDDRSRHRLRIETVLHTTSQPIVVSHASAAALWGLPWLGQWPTQVHGRRACGRPRSTVNLRLHTGPPALPDMIGGIPVTPICETVIDLARTSAFEQAVVVADAALAGRAASTGRRLAAADLAAAAQNLPLRQGSAKVRAVLEFADAASGSPGESLSRASMFQAGIALPVLQQAFAASEGRRWEVDFWWPEYGVIGEFDGRGKYLRPELMDGRSPGEVVFAEKRREDGLRALGHRVVRWGWAEASRPSVLRGLLVAAGVPLA